MQGCEGLDKLHEDGENLAELHEGGKSLGSGLVGDRVVQGSCMKVERARLAGLDHGESVWIVWAGKEAQLGRDLLVQADWNHVSDRVQLGRDLV